MLTIGDSTIASDTATRPVDCIDSNLCDSTKVRRECRDVERGTACRMCSRGVRCAAANYLRFCSTVQEHHLSIARA
jgi:hypothetical protein